MAKAKKETLSLDELLEQSIVKEEDRPYEVPGNWVWARLGNIVEVIMGQSPSGSDTTDDSQFTPLIGGASDMGDLYPDVTRYTLKPTKLSRKNDVIVSIRATLGRPIFSDGEYCLGRGVSAIRSNLIMKEFIRYLFLNFEVYLYEVSTGTTFAQVSKIDIENMPFTLPPLSEQQRIVEVIETLFEKLDKAKEMVQNALDSFESRKAAILHKAFTGELTARWREGNGVSLESWVEATLEECAFSMQNGISKRSGKDGVPKVVLRLANIKDNTIDICDLRSILLDEKEVSRYSIDRNDILIIRVNGSVDNVGKLILIDNEEKWTFCDHLIKLKTDKDKVLPKFLVYKSMTDDYKQFVKLNMVSSAGQNTISQKSLNNFALSIPSIKEQQEVVRILDNLLEKEQRAKELSDVIEKIEQMKKAILARAFRGELRTNDPEEESAVELLKEVLKDKV